MRSRIPALLTLGSGLVVAGCPGHLSGEVPRHPAPAPQAGQLAGAPAAGSLGIVVRWPLRTVQGIPSSTQWIHVRIEKGGTPLQELSLSRPTDSGGPLLAAASVQLDAAEDLVVKADAYGSSPQASGDLPVASAVATGVAVVANQRTMVRLDLVPRFVPALSAFSPTNGGPGTLVTLSGDFGESGYYGMTIGGQRGYGSGSSSSIEAFVPPGAVTGPVAALADGIPSGPGATFSVLGQLLLDAPSPVASVGATLSLAVTASDTASKSVANPTITRWEFLDPSRMDFLGKLSPSDAGRLDGNGVLTALATGTGWAFARSGILTASVSITVQ